jgi:carbamoyl-phosphate synthase large subunit
MPKRDDIHKILIIGSGPIIIGQACEFDYSGTQACKALRSMGYEVVVVNADPATVMTDPGMAGATYIEPLNLKTLTEIIAKEKPDALLPNLGGQSGLNLSFQLDRSGVLETYGVQVIGVSVAAIERGEDRSVFKATMERLGIETLRSRAVNTVEDAEEAAETLGYPVVVRPSFAMGGTGSGLVYNVEELKTIAARGLTASLVNQILVEESVLGWEELELEVVRDAKNQTITVCFIENVDAMGVHTGDSFCTIPMLTIDPELQQRLQQYSYDIVEAIGVVGGANLQFAHDPKTGRAVVIEINPRTSRSSALASKATGFPIARISSLLAGGMTLDEIPCRRGGTLANYTPSSDCVAVKFPRWAFEKFEGSQDRLGTQMRAVGEVMGLGKTYKEALQKAIRSLEINRYGLGFAKDFNTLPLKELLAGLDHPSSERQFLLYEALRKGADIDALVTKTRINPWFIQQMRELVELEEKILAHQGGSLPDELLIQAKQDGFADKYLAMLLNRSEEEIREQRKRLGLRQAWEPVPVSGVENATYYYATYNAADKVPVSNRRKIMLLGGGPGRIGQSIEFDTSCVHAALAIRDAGYESIMVNCNPETVSTDYDVSDRLYFEPVTVEDVLGIYEKEKPEGVVVQFGGQTPLNIAGELESVGVTILGTASADMDSAQDRDRFRHMMRDLGIPQPESGEAGTIEEAEGVAQKIGYPLLVRHSHALGGRDMEVVHNEEALQYYLETAAGISPSRPILLDKFLDNAIEAEADAITDGADAFVPAVMEHIELAGIHSGDSACVVPPVSIAPKHIDTINEYTRKISTALKNVGLMNIQYAIFENTVYVLEANPGASRTVPLVSKICNIGLAGLSMSVMLGRRMGDLGLKHRIMHHYGIKEAVFPFNMFPEVDPILGPEMRSTGEVLGLSRSYGRAFFKAQEATQTSLPLEGAVLFTIADRDKTAALEAVRLFKELGFSIMTTEGTHYFLEERGVENIPIRKMGYGRPDLVDAIKNGTVNLLVNTPSGRRSSQDSSYMRKAAIKFKVPYITTTAAAVAAAKGISARRSGTPKVRSLQEYHADMGQ